MQNFAQRKVYLFDFKTCRHLFKKYLNFYILLNVCPGRPRSRTTLSWGRPARRRCRRSRRVLGNKVSFYCFVYLPNWNFIFLDEDDGSSVLPEPCDTSKIRADKYFLPFELGKWGDSKWKGAEKRFFFGNQLNLYESIPVPIALHHDGKNNWKKGLNVLKQSDWKSYYVD